jgi:Ni,Fe-hydrogenase III small subunit
VSGPRYDFERFGLEIVSSPRHADILLVTGPFTRAMQEAALATFAAMPRPRRVVTVGDGFRPGSVYRSSYAIIDLPEELAHDWVLHIMGDPPSPGHILSALLELDTQ